MHCMIKTVQKMHLNHCSAHCELQCIFTTAMHVMHCNAYYALYYSVLQCIVCINKLPLSSSLPLPLPFFTLVQRLTRCACHCGLRVPRTNTLLPPRFFAPTTPVCRSMARQCLRRVATEARSATVTQALVAASQAIAPAIGAALLGRS